MADKATEPANVGNADVPAVVKGARAFLVVGMCVWLVGVVLAAVDIWRAFGEGPSVRGVRQSVALLVWRGTLLSVAIVAYRCVRRRQPLGRWLTMTLAMLAFYLTLPSVNQAWRATRGDYRAPDGAIAYSSPEEGVGALAGNLLVMGGLAFLVRQLAAGRKSIQYFSADSTHEGSDAA